MRTEELRIGMKVNHPNHGLGVVKSISEQLAEIRFDDGTHTVAPDTSGMEPAGEQAAISGLQMPLNLFIQQVIEETVENLNLVEQDITVDALAERWKDGKLVLHPHNPALQPKEVPLEIFFHKIVMMRNNLRTLEQKINAHKGLSDSEKFELQQYISRSYGSMTTFNVLFKRTADQFNSGD